MQMRAVAGRYRLIRVLGRGGMGAVYLAEDPLAGRLADTRQPPTQTVDPVRGRIPVQ